MIYHERTIVYFFRSHAIQPVGRFSNFYLLRQVQKKIIIHIYFASCVGFMWQGFSSGGAAGVASVRRDQRLPRVRLSKFQLAPKQTCHWPKLVSDCFTVVFAHGGNRK